MKVIAVVGNGIAGSEAAEAARRVDPQARVVLMTKEPFPLYSACVLADYVADRIPVQRVILRTAEDFGKAGIELLLSSQVMDWSAEEQLLNFDDGNLRYDRLVIATGSRPFVPDLPGFGKQGVVALKNLQDAEMLRAAQGSAAVVVGTGPVGIEAAIALRRRGWTVALVELLDRVLPRLFDAPLAAALKKRLEDHGIDVFLGERVLEITGKTHAAGVKTDRRTLVADAVVLVIGMRPELSLVKKDEVALGSSGGIQVDRQMKTSREGVWACGDCVESEDLITGRRGLFMLWHNARLQGRIAGANAAGALRRYPGSLNLTTVNVFDETAASVGILASEVPRDEARVLHRKGPWGELWMVLKDQSLIGVQALGRTERVGGLMGMIAKGKDLRKALLKEPTSAEGPGGWILRGVRKDLLRLMGSN